jgi:nucleotide-binding universal stress UspA family protein
MNPDQKNLRILICIGGGPAAYTGLRFAARLNRESCADISLMYVRPLDSGLKSGGMEVRVARENVLDWGLELPGLRHLKAARDILLEMGQIDEGGGDAWRYRELSGDDAGEYVRDYQNPCGGTISLRLRISPDVTTAVVDEAKRFDADVVVVGATEEPRTGLRRYLSPKPLALKIAAHVHCSAMVARDLEAEHGHLVCVRDSERCMDVLPKAARCAGACGCPVTILSVARDEAGLETARQAVECAANLFRERGVEPKATLIEMGDPVDTITTLGADFSLIVMAESEKPWFAKGFSVAHEVAARAGNSVLILK